MGTFDHCFHEGSIWTGHRAILSFILQKSTFLRFVNHGNKFYNRYIKYDGRTKYIDDNGSSVKPKYKVRNIYHSKYQHIYGNKSYVIPRNYLKDTRICRTH